MFRSPRRGSRTSRRGNAATAVVALLPLLGFTALAVDIGAYELANTELQAAVDVAALAGVAYMDGTEEGLDIAIAKTIEFGAMNNVLGQPVRLSTDDVKPGFYNSDEDRFEVTWDPARAYALMVTGTVSDVSTPFAGVAFGQYFAQTEATALAKASAHGGAGEVACFIPIAIPDCMIDRGAIEQMALRMSSANDDNAGWSRIGASPNAAYLKDQIAGMCEGGNATVGDDVGLQNGQVTSALSAIDSELESSSTPWDTAKWGALPPQMCSGADDGNSVSTVANYGYVLEGPIILFETPNGTCGASTQFNQFATITGFAWGVVYDVDSKGNGKNIRMKLDMTTEYEIGISGGGIDTNVTYVSDGALVY